MAEAEAEITQKHLTPHYHALGSSEALIYRLIRLRALSESPSYFGSTFARELAFSLETWQTRLKNPDSVMFLATSRAVLKPEDSLASDGWVHPAQFETSDRLHYGMICCIKSFEDPTDVLIVSFWVAPLARRKGIGRKLVNLALEWARSHQTFKAALLNVQMDNIEARHLYERCGFTSIGEDPQDPDGLRYIHHLRRASGDTAHTKSA